MKKGTNISIATKVFVIDDEERCIREGSIESIYQDIHKHTAKLYWRSSLGTFSVEDIFLDLDTLHAALSTRKDKEQKTLDSKYSSLTEQITYLKSAI